MIEPESDLASLNAVDLRAMGKLLLILLGIIVGLWVLAAAVLA